MINKDNFLDGLERIHRKRTPDVISYKDYLEHLPQEIQKIMRDRPPEASHHFEPGELISIALSHSITKSDIHPGGYRIEMFEGRCLVMSVVLLTESGETIIAIFKYLKDPRESVILITADDGTVISSQIDDICAKVRENISTQLRRRSM